MLVKYNPNNWFYRSIDAVKVDFVTVDKNNNYKVEHGSATMNVSLTKLRVLDKEHLNDDQIDAEYKRILSGKVQNILPEGVTLVDLVGYSEVSYKYAFTLDELIGLGHPITETEDGFMIEVK